jgi:protein-disulfide isomerase
MTFNRSMRALKAVIVAAAVGLVAVPATHFAKADDKKADAFTPAQKDQLRQMMHDYILEHPEVIMDAVNALQAKEDQAKEAKQTAAVRERKKDLLEQTDGTVIGNPKGDVTLVEFFDYNCGYCKAMFPTMMDAVKQDGKIRLVLKEFPILGPASVTATRAALAARKQGKYSELHLALLGHKGGLTDETVMQIAKDAGLDLDKLKKDMQDPEVTAIIAKNRALAETLSIEGTPAIIVGDTLVPGAVDKDRLAQLLKGARKS